MTEKQQMTTQEIVVYKACHHDFAGLAQANAAEVMGISQSQVSRILKKIEQEHPELFPILNSRQQYIYKRIVKHGDTHKVIARLMNLTVRTVERIVSQMRRKGVSFNSPIKTIKYQDYMDSSVKHTY